MTDAKAARRFSETFCAVMGTCFREDAEVLNLTPASLIMTPDIAECANAALSLGTRWSWDSLPEGCENDKPQDIRHGFSPNRRFIPDAILGRATFLHMSHSVSLGEAILSSAFDFRQAQVLRHPDLSQSALAISEALDVDCAMDLEELLDFVGDARMVPR